MGCDISMSVLMHQYPTREEILCGAGFDSTPFLGSGYSGTFKSGVPSAEQVNECVERYRQINKAATAAEVDRLRAQSQTRG
jgi:hypothetical protein